MKWKKEREGMGNEEEEGRERARKEIHAGKLRFGDWVESQGGILDSGMFQPTVCDK